MILAATSSLARKGATTTPMRRTTRSAGSTGTSRRTARISPSSSRSSSCCVRRCRCCVAARFLQGRFDEEIGAKDVTWMSPSGGEMQQAEWDDAGARCFGVLLDGRAQAEGIKRIGSDATMLLVLNAHHDVVNFKLPQAPGGRRWHCIIDTNTPNRDELVPFEFETDYMATGARCSPSSSSPRMATPCRTRRTRRSSTCRKPSAAPPPSGCTSSGPTRADRKAALRPSPARNEKGRFRKEAALFSCRVETSFRRARSGQDRLGAHGIQARRRTAVTRTAETQSPMGRGTVANSARPALSACRVRPLRRRPRPWSRR